MTVTLHKSITQADGHGILSALGPYANTAARQAATVTAAHVAQGSVCRQTDTGDLYFLASQSGGVPTWVKFTTTADTGSFSGDFAALATTYSLTTRAEFLAHLGTSGTTGTGITAWANQSGTAGNVSVATGATNGIGTLGTGLNGHASLIANGTNQGGFFTMPTQVAPATVNFHKYWFVRYLATPTGSNNLFYGGSASSTVYINGGQTSPACDQVIYNAGGGPATSGVVLNQWYRGRASYTGSASDFIRVGAHQSSASTTSNTAPSTNRSIFCDTGGNSLVSAELLGYLEFEGTLANFNLFCADADPKARTFWTTAIEI